MNGQRKAAAWCGRLLLFAALVLGIVTMHILGHPAEHGSSHMPDGSVVATASGPTGHARQPMATEESRADDPPPLGGMDPMSVCLAVLSVWTIALLVTGALSRRPAGRLAALARLSPALWPIPPPGSHRTLLAQLSVLRI
ncbi:hypothetical protein ABZ078_33165 [Streptomyces sp. NPDC006385]|uniref:hypothetical protein n=1 Tax=Streptomyces sp. NPDC006385 TaxID=3156761 RepID=UPI0033A98B20